MKVASALAEAGDGRFGILGTDRSKQPPEGPAAEGLSHLHPVASRRTILADHGSDSGDRQEDAMEFLKRRSDEIYALTRIVVGFLFLCHGLDKLDFLLTGVSFAGNAAGYAQMPLPLGWVAGLIEALAGAAVMLGFFAGPAAFLASGMMAVAYFMAHQKSGALPIQNHGELAALYSWVFLLVASRGSGIWSVDAARGAS
jgi:putative oxidoreductase